MTCIIVGSDPMTINVIKMLINQMDDLTLTASFENTSEASVFMTKNAVDLVFFDNQMDETKSYRFIKTIPGKTFVIFISELSSTTISSISFRFQKGVDMARTYSGIVGKENSNISGDYFVI